MPFDPIMQYKEQAVSTMSKGEQLVELFNEALKNLRYGSRLLNENQFEAAAKCTNKSKRIFNYLSSILNDKYSVSGELYQLYYFINQETIRAEIKRDASILEGVIPLVEELSSTWAQAEKLSHMHK